MGLNIYFSNCSCRLRRRLHFLPDVIVMRLQMLSVVGRVTIVTVDHEVTNPWHHGVWGAQGLARNYFLGIHHVGLDFFRIGHKSLNCLVWLDLHDSVDCLTLLTCGLGQENLVLITVASGLRVHHPRKKPNVFNLCQLVHQIRACVHRLVS